MSITRSLLVELLVEELPPKALRRLGQAFASRLADELVRHRSVEPEDADRSKYFASPRRLAVLVPGVYTTTSPVREVRKLMPKKTAFGSDGSSSAALQKKLQGMGYASGAVPAGDLVFKMEGETEFVYLNQVIAGRVLATNLQQALEAALKALPILKVMQYQLADGWTTVSFVRPVHGLVALHDADIVDVSVLGLRAGRATDGHRFEAAVSRIEFRGADAYVDQLRDEGAVIASFEERRAEIARQLSEAAMKEGLNPIDDDALLDEVTALVERPNVLLCQFEPQFLAVPPECLILTMKANQKYFPLLDAAGALTNKFLVVSNIRPDDPSAVIQGNERVVRPRLADAKFFFDQDRKKTLESRLPGLDKVVYHAKLGSMGDRVQRVRTIARAIGERLGGPSLAAQAQRGALLAKTDLLTDMVGEFPELQGVMGGYYARHDGETEAIAFAIEDHYKPRFAGDALPRDEVGLVVALADKIETLAGMFGIGQIPSGDKDPFALRRHALGVIRMLVERSRQLSLHDLINLAYTAFAQGMLGQNQSELSRFMLDRFSGLLREQGFGAHEIDAVMSTNPVAFDLVPRQLQAVREFVALPEASSLAAANKRIANILKKSDATGALKIEPGLFAEDAERALHGALNDVAPRAEAAYRKQDYTGSLRELAALRAPVDAFFEHVMVNADDPKLRANRLALLAALHHAMNRVADLSRLAA